MHPSHCMVNCTEEDCSCNPTRHDLAKLAADDLLKAAKGALEYLESRGLDGGQVGASLYNAITKATGKDHK